MPEAAPRQTSPRWRPRLIAAVAGALAFQGELLAGKRLLPEFGGAAYVWCGTVLFFQIVLIAGYFGSRRLNQISSGTARSAIVLLGASGLLALLPGSLHASFLPLELQPLAAALPFAGLSMALFCTTPLLHSRQVDRTDFSIYAWSNAGAFIGLLTYPLLIEPLSSLREQMVGWAVAGLLICVFGFGSGAIRSAEINTTAPGRARWQWWIFPALSSAIMLATTNQLGFEASAGPLTWAFPLALFLASYVWAFSGDRRASLPLFVVLGLVALVALFLLPGLQLVNLRSKWLIALVLLDGGAAMLACHVWLAHTRTADTHSFYRAAAVGGALGSVLELLVIPRVTTGPVEFQVLTLALLAVAGLRWGNRWWQFVVTVLAVIAAGALLTTAEVRRPFEITRARTLYGWLRVTRDSDPDKDVYILLNNTTIHGEEDRRNPAWDMLYYGRTTGLGACVTERQQAHSSVNIGVVGLGAGGIANLLRDSDTVTFYEINPKVEEFARKYFSYLGRSHSRVVIGDGRKLLEAETGPLYDVLVLDAFNGDAIPTHLLTAEAGAIYQRHLKPDGVLAVHITNHHVNLQTVAEGLAQSMGRSYLFVPTGDTDWAILSPGKEAVRPDALLWTDERNSILPVLKWR